MNNPIAASNPDYTPEFNYGLAQAMTIRYYLTQANECARFLDVFGWFHNLLVISRELSDDMNDEQRTATKKFTDELAPDVEQFIGKQNASGGTQRTPFSLIMRLSNYECWLRQLSKDLGYKGKGKGDLLEPDEEW